MVINITKYQLINDGDCLVVHYLDEDFQEEIIEIFNGFPFEDQMIILGYFNGGKDVLAGVYNDDWAYWDKYKTYPVIASSLTLWTVEETVSKVIEQLLQ